MLLFQNVLERDIQRMIEEGEEITEELLQSYVTAGLVECKRSIFGLRKQYVITEKGKEFLDNKLFEKLRYIQ